MQSRNSHLTPKMQGETRLEAETLPTYLELWDAKAREGFLDSLTCYLHNEGHSLQHNSQLLDADWLARVMFARHEGAAMNDLERASEAAQKQFRKMAEVAIECLPALCDRIGSRYITAKAAIETELSRARATTAAAQVKPSRVAQLEAEVKRLSDELKAQSISQRATWGDEHAGP